MGRGVATCSLQAVSCRRPRGVRGGQGPRALLSSVEPDDLPSGSSCGSGAASSALEGVSRQQKFLHCSQVEEQAKPADKAEGCFQVKLTMFVKSLISGVGFSVMHSLTLLSFSLLKRSRLSSLHKVILFLFCFKYLQRY